MPDYLQTSGDPLTSAQWETLRDAVVTTARASLVDRRIISLVGPLGPGVEALPSDLLTGASSAEIDILGDDEGKPITTVRRRYLPLPLIYKDFWIHWRDLESNHEFGFPIDSGKAAAAASAVAHAEDRLVFLGDESLGLNGLTDMPGRNTLPMRDWATEGNGFQDVVDGIRKLTAAGFPGPYALVTSPELYAELNRVFDNTGVLEIEQVEKLARRGVYAASVLPEPSTLLVDSSAANLDLAVGLDFTVAFVESNNLNFKFRVVESIVLRVRRPGAILTYEAHPAGE
ncbi:MAG TPA: family 1 encapsulin nanocompartment shell protein [Chloroflexota bacterium]|nr:family 1 encapsulin nanocompartment shell protein [Chloroflexota bacterium]